ncbi:hypothetical protein FSP39_012515 [Pinctada imbricata]|uniref:Pyridoxal phosphate homeostasis protein n=1 Tax=Pinctada imbricata TaxID=66713 RepID=A0AA88YET4_PINIB|nr:hypothetical protein FSP39_012515 [Pinctada imbricata]
MAGKNEISSAIKVVREKIEAATKRRPDNFPGIEPTLVAVSKTKPVDMIIEAYSCGIRHFGENYANELLEKAQDSQVLENCKDIRWHYIGQFQTKNIRKLLGLQNLHMIETLQSEKNATFLNSTWERLTKPGKLQVMVQVNTSGEDNKNGCPPENASDLVKFVLEKCPHLQFCGLMTIGAYGYDTSKGPNPDFLRLVSCKELVVSNLGLDSSQMGLSMGMSTDYEHAIELGSTNVRVGSIIFGAREPPKKNVLPVSTVENQVVQGTFKRLQ